MRNQVLSILFLFLTAHINWANADSKMMGMPDLTTAKLMPVCLDYLKRDESEANYLQGLCVGIILGVEDNAQYDKKICIPKNVGIRERVMVVSDYVATQPKRMNEAFASLVFDALLMKWPCKN